VHWGQVGVSFLAGDENEEVIVFQVCIASGIEKWKFDLPALLRKVVTRKPKKGKST